MPQVSIALPLFSGSPAPGSASPVPAGASEGASPFADMVEAMTAGLPATGPDVPDLPGGDLTLAGLDPAATDGVYAALAALAAKAAATDVAAAGTDQEIAIAIPKAKPETAEAQASVLPSAIALAAAAFGKKPEDGRSAEGTRPAEGEAVEAGGEAEDTDETLGAEVPGMVPPALALASVPPPAPALADPDLPVGDTPIKAAAAGAAQPPMPIISPTGEGIASPAAPLGADAEAATEGASGVSASTTAAIAATVPPIAPEKPAGPTPVGVISGEAVDGQASADARAATREGTPAPAASASPAPADATVSPPGTPTLPAMASAFAPSQTDEALAALAALAKDAPASAPAVSDPSTRAGTSGPLAADPLAPGALTPDPLGPDVEIVLTGPAIPGRTQPQGTAPAATLIDDVPITLAAAPAVAASDDEGDGAVESVEPALPAAAKSDTVDAKTTAPTPPVKPSDLPVLDAVPTTDQTEEARAETVAGAATKSAAVLDDLDEALARDVTSETLPSRPDPARTPPPVAATALAFAARLKRDTAESRTDAGSEAAQVAALGARQAAQATQAVAQSVAPPATVLNMVPIPVVGAEIARMAKLGETSFQIRLDPPELGRIDVSLDLSDTGEAKAHLTVERRDTLDLFARDHRALERALREAGFEARDGSVSVSLRNGGSGDGNPRFAGNQFQDGNARPQFASPYGDGTSLEADASTITAADLYRPRRDALVDVRL